MIAVRLLRAARRYIATGKFRCAPGPMIERFFGGKDCFFVQVGSNDGVFRDPLHDLIKANPAWRGIFIEPLEEPFMRLLVTHHGETRFVFERLAIADGGDRSFYFVSPSAGLPREMSAISSFDRSYVLSNLRRLKLKDPESCISTMQVRCESLMSLLRRNRVERVDVLHIDAETHDYQILRQIDFSRYRPKLVLYEHNVLSPEDQHNAESLLSGEGYRLVNCRIDTLAIRRE
jgi:FkbM family methyltransferase